MKTLVLLLACLLLTTVQAEDTTPKPKGYDQLFLPPSLSRQRFHSLPCDECDGAGYALQTLGNVEDLGGTYKKKCVRCKGSGKCLRAYTPREALDAQKKMRMAFDNEHLKQGHQPFAGAYVKHGALEGLTPREYAHLAHAHQVPEKCVKCYGLGFEECRKCDGKGYSEKIQRIPSSRKRRLPEEKEETIKEPCEKCRATGRLECKKCDGVGLKPLCRKCDGTGLVIAKKKITTPEKKRLTTTEEILCKSCDGTGRR